MCGDIIYFSVRPGTLTSSQAGRDWAGSRYPTCSEAFANFKGGASISVVRDISVVTIKETHSLKHDSQVSQTITGECHDLELP